MSENGSPAGIPPAEPLSRFIFSSSHFSRENLRVKHNAFMPATDGRTSVFRTIEMEQTTIWSIGEKIAAERTQTLHARGDILASDIFKAKLAVVPSEPPPRHANIQDWPAEKSAQKLKAIELADAAKLILKL